MASVTGSAPEPGKAPAAPVTSVNAMSVDVEEYFHAWALSPAIPRERWDAWPSRVEAGTRRALELFAAAGVRATFFVLGRVAARHKGLVREIVAAGHELASHGHAHHKVAELGGPRAFREDVLTTRLLLEDAGGVAVRGYRAPSFSIGPREWWAYAALAGAGYAYSSSLHPIRHDHYGLPAAPRHPFRPVAGLPLVEVPVATVELAGGRRRASCAGGGRFRLLPYAVSRRRLARLNSEEGRSATFYFHPWEIDPGQPRVPGLPWRSRFRHYVNLGTMEGKLARLLADFRWGRIDEVHADDLAAADGGRAALPAWRPEGAAA